MIDFDCNTSNLIGNAGLFSNHLIYIGRKTRMSKASLSKLVKSSGAQVVSVISKATLCITGTRRVIGASGIFFL